jgi:glycosyltransferase involved in cell wall biosynthesis
MKLDPCVSIIIAVYNGAKSLQTCLDSIIEQSFKDWQLIIIDGGSTDGTVDIIRSNEQHIQYWISEADNGIYDAWNKGVEQSSGDWIAFLGCDDTFAHPDALTHMSDITLQDPSIEFLSGKAHLLDAKGQIKRVMGSPWQWSRFRHFMGVIVHLGAWHSRRLFDRLGKFDPSYKIAGDYEFLLRAGPYLCTGFIPEIIVNMGGTGVSSKYAIRACWESYRAQRDTPYIRNGEAWLNLLLIIVKYYGGAVKHGLRRT